MRPLFHPSIEDVTVEGILHALSDPVRVAIFVQIVGSNCSQNCSNFLNVSEKAIPKSTLSLHFKALERRRSDSGRTSRRRDAQHFTLLGSRPALSRLDCGHRQRSQGPVGTEIADRECGKTDAFRQGCERMNSTGNRLVLALS